MVEGRGADEGELDRVQHTPYTDTEGAIWRTLNGPRSGKPPTQPGGSTYVEPTGVSQGLERVREAALGQRMQKFGLELNTEKTRLIEFGRFAIDTRAERGDGKPETFEFLGFTHICARRRKDGRFVLRRKNIARRCRAKVREVTQELKRRRHDPMSEQGKWIRSVVRGYYNYYAMPGNTQALNRFRKQVARAWLRALRRRSHKGRNMTWARMQKLLNTWLPQPKILHPYPNQRLCVTNPT